MEDWHGRLRRGSIVMCWAEPGAAGGLGLSTLGEPPKDVVVHDAVLLVRRALPGAAGDAAPGTPNSPASRVL